MAPTTKIWRVLYGVFLLAGVVSAETLEVRVLDPDGNPVPDVAVFADLAGADAVPGREPATAIMDQRDMRFVPHILMVRAGDSVEFPNSDVTAHHVYSFSKPNNFVLPLYKGVVPDPVTFEHDGVVTLGCNIHDQMLGYIVVVDTDVFGLTNEAGVVELDIPDTATAYDVSIWSARIRDSKGTITQSVTGASSGNLTFELSKKLRPPHDEQADTIEWSEY